LVEAEGSPGNDDNCLDFSDVGGGKCLLISWPTIYRYWRSFFFPVFELKNLICKFGDAFVHKAGFKRRNFVILDGGYSEGGKRSSKHVEIV